MAAVVPTNDHGLFPLVSQDADGGRRQREQPSISRIEAQPPRGEHPQEVAVAEQDDLSFLRPRLLDQPVGSGADIGRALSVGGAVAPHRPVRHLATDLDGPSSLVVAVVPLPQVLADPGLVPQPGEAARLPSPGRRAGEHTGEAAPAQPVTQNHRLRTAEVGERNVATARVPPIPGPVGLTMSDQHQARSTALVWLRHGETHRPRAPGRGSRRVTPRPGPRPSVRPCQLCRSKRSP